VPLVIRLFVVNSSANKVKGNNNININRSMS
jgi:hypothetical protein